MIDRVNKVSVSVVCPIYNEEKYIQNFLQSILQQDFPKEKLEVLFIDGMSTDNTYNILSNEIKNYPFCRILINSKRTVPYALNLGIINATGDVIIRLDAHCKYPHNYISSLIYWLYKLNADNVGGLWKTYPSSSSAESLSIAIASSNIFGVGNSYHKTGVSKIIETDTVPFGCYRASIFDKIGKFDEDLTRNQDDEFNGRVIKNGGKIYLIPDIEIKYYARESLIKMTKMYFQYGLFKPLVNLKLGRPSTLRQFAPITYLIFISFGLIFSLLSYYFLILYLFINMLYFSIGFLIGLKNAIEYKKISLCIFLPITFFLIHISYGYGYLLGLFKVNKFNKNKIKVETSR